MNKNSLISVWCSVNIINLFALLEQIKKELSKKTVLNDVLFEKYDEIGESLVKLRLLLTVLQIFQKAQSLQSLTKRDRCGLDFCIYFIKPHVVGTVHFIEEKAKDWLACCESLTSQDVSNT